MMLKLNNFKLFSIGLGLLIGVSNVGAQVPGDTKPMSMPPELQSASIQNGSGNATDKKTLVNWFNQYDQIRRKAQLSPKDKARANELLSKGLAIIIPGDDKKETQKLLGGLVTRYSTAEEQIKLLPLYPETEKLHRGYYQYFNNAKLLFSDYMAVQNNVLATDSFGNPLAQSLMTRKQNLETLDSANKNFDVLLRKKFGIEAYKYGVEK